MTTTPDLPVTTDSDTLEPALPGGLPHARNVMRTAERVLVLLVLTLLILLLADRL